MRPARDRLGSFYFFITIRDVALVNSQISRLIQSHNVFLVCAARAGWYCILSMNTFVFYLPGVGSYGVF
jgi:hypothetical protein